MLPSSVSTASRLIHRALVAVSQPGDLVGSARSVLALPLPRQRQQQKSPGATHRQCDIPVDVKLQCGASRHLDFVSPRGSLAHYLVHAVWQYACSDKHRKLCISNTSLICMCSQQNHVSAWCKLQAAMLDVDAMLHVGDACIHDYTYCMLASSCCVQTAILSCMLT